MLHRRTKELGEHARLPTAKLVCLANELQSEPGFVWLPERQPALRRGSLQQARLASGRNPDVAGRARTANWQEAPRRTLGKKHSEGCAYAMVVRHRPDKCRLGFRPRWTAGTG